MSVTSSTIKLSSLNGHLICGLCGGYLIDATVLSDCIHVFCRSCILKYLIDHKVCPLCQSLIQETRPGHTLRPDVVLQRVVYKLVPGLLQTEMRRLSEFRTSCGMPAFNNLSSISSSDAHVPLTKPYPGKVFDFCGPPLPTALATRSLSRSPSTLSLASPLSGDRFSVFNRVLPSVAYLIDENELISISLTYSASNMEPLVIPPNHIDQQCCLNSAVPRQASYSYYHSETIHLLCPSVVTIQTLHNLLLAKYQLDPTQLIVDLYLDGECLQPSHSLREVAFMYCFPVKHRRMCFDFVFAEARLAWWGRPMPRLEPPCRKDRVPFSPNDWLDTSDSIGQHVTIYRRSKSTSSDASRSEVEQKLRRTSL